MFPLGNDTLQVSLACKPVELAPLAVDVARVQQRRGLLAGLWERRKFFPLDERPGSQVLTIEPEKVESVEHGRRMSPAAPQQFVELRPAFGVQANDLTIENSFALQLGTD